MQNAMLPPTMADQDRVLQILSVLSLISDPTAMKKTLLELRKATQAQHDILDKQGDTLRDIELKIKVAQEEQEKAETAKGEAQLAMTKAQEAEAKAKAAQQELKNDKQKAKDEFAVFEKEMFERDRILTGKENAVEAALAEAETNAARAKQLAEQYETKLAQLKQLAGA